MMECPRCGMTTKVTRSAFDVDDNTVIRRRCCPLCDFRFKTMEIMTDEVKRYDKRYKRRNTDDKT